MRSMIAAVCVLLVGVSAHADAVVEKLDREMTFDIAPQVLDAALLEFGHQADLQLMFAASDFGGRKTRGVQGKMAAAKALDVLLLDTGLIYQAMGDNTVTVKPAKIAQSELAVSQGDTAVLAQAESDTSASNTENTESTESVRPDEVVVSASRIDRRGLDTPTPVMVLSADDLREGARPNVAAALQDLPQFKASSAPQVTGGSTFAATAAIDLRGLTNRAAPRTLVLVDGRRFVGGSSNGGGDFSLLPSSLIGRVDVVTGGSSAAWGSGAVAGVVNIIIDEKLTGGRFDTQGSISNRGDAEEMRFDAAFGTGFANERGHVVLGGEFVDNTGITSKTERTNTGRWAVVTNPNFTPTNGQKPNIIASDVGIATASPGGLILSGVNAGMTFNPDGTLRNFDRGRISGTQSIGGEAPSLDDVVALVAPNTRYATLGRAIYDFTDTIKGTAEIRHSRTYNSFSQGADVNRGAITVRADNAFLPAAIRTQMLAAGESSFTMGRFNADYALVVVDFEREVTEGTLALDGEIADTWRWGAYYSHGEFAEQNRTNNQRIVLNFNRAVDSLISPTTGQPVCRVNADASTINDDPACVPINIFGEGVPSQQARNYVLGDGSGHTTRKLDVGGVSLRGEPFELWAGPASVATGIEARREFIETRVSAFDQANQLGFFNQAGFAPADMTTEEGFGEILIPVVRNVPALQLLELDAAARITDDVSGSVWSWKVGITNKVTDDLRLRVARSRDIRSPSLSELFTAAQPNFVTIIDPANNNQPYAITATSGRNPALAPELSNTFSAGATLTPSAIQGLTLSVDYFDIDINGAIGTVTPQDRVNRCFNGNQALCSGVSRDANGILTGIVGSLVNLSTFKTSGIDASIDYDLPLDLAGALNVRSSLTWLREFMISDGVTTVDHIGTQGVAFTFGAPRVRWNTTLRYTTERFGASLRARYISAGYYNKNLSIENNRIPAYVYFDLGLNWRIKPTAERTGLEVFANINNLFDKEPPIESRNSHYYDVIGTYLAAGVRVRF